MRKLTYLVLLILLIAVPLLGQDAQYWGKDGPDIEWNKATRFNADSTDFFGSTATQLDTAGTDSIFYSQMIMTKGDAYEGIFNLTISFDSLGITPSNIDSIDLAMRRYFDSDLHTYDYWGSWRTIQTGLSVNTRYEWEIADYNHGGDDDMQERPDDLITDEPPMLDGE